MQNILVQFVVNIHIKLVDKRVAEQIAIAIAKVLALEYQMLMVAVIMLVALFLA